MKPNLPETGFKSHLNRMNFEIFRQFLLSVPICRIGSLGPFPLQPYYCTGKNVKFYSTIQEISDILC